MGTVTLPNLNQTGTNEWEDVEGNDRALRDEINGNLDNTNLKAAAAVALSKLASGTSAQIIVANASGVPTYVAMSGDATISNAGAVSLASNSVLANEVGSLPVARVFHSANQTTASNTPFTLAFDSERFDTDTMHNTVTNNSRLTATTAGVYLITGHIDWASGAAGKRQVRILLNGTTLIAVNDHKLGSTDTSAQSVSTVYKLAASDFVELVVVQIGATNLDVLASANFSPEFAMTWLGDG